MIQSLMASRVNGETLIYLIGAIIWVILQIAGAARKRKREMSEPRRQSAPRPVRPSEPPPVEIPMGEDPLQDFLRQLTAREPASPAAPPPPPVPIPLAPSRPAPVRAQRAKPRPTPPRQAPAVRTAIHHEPVPETAKFKQAFAAVRATAGTELRMAPMRFISMPSFALPAPGSAAGRRREQKIRKAFRSGRSRAALRDAWILKTLLDPPRSSDASRTQAHWMSGTG